MPYLHDKIRLFLFFGKVFESNISVKQNLKIET